jgi:acyl-CoA synthetase (AMP-forming)/AMP-acid ligase II
MNRIFPQSGILPATLVDMLRERADRQREREAFLFLRYRAVEQPEIERLTYGALLARAKAVAGALQRGCARGDRALILAPPGLDYITAFFGCQLAGVTAVPAYPPRNVKHMDRLKAIASDCGAAAVLTVADLAGRLAEWGAGQLPHPIAVDALPDDVAATWRDANVRPHDLAFLQYTSGTTGTPKGVMVGHDNLMASLTAVAACLGSSADDIAVSWLPPYHDFGLVGGLLLPVFAGYRSVMMPPAAFLQKPSRWIRALSDHRATITMAPNFGYELACRHAATMDLEILDLSSLRHAASGGEPPRASTLDRFARRFGPAGFKISAFMPGYGLAETTLQVTVARASIAPRLLRVSEGGGRAGSGQCRSAKRTGSDGASDRFERSGDRRS